MSRFSKAEAEAAGWSFAHEQVENVDILGDGISRTKPASLRAEKYQDGKIINEEADSIGKLLERIALYEAFHAGRITPELEPLDSTDSDAENARVVEEMVAFQSHSFLDGGEEVPESVTAPLGAIYEDDPAPHDPDVHKPGDGEDAVEA